MRKWMIEFLRTFENRAIKIARVNSILITKYINLQLFTSILNGVGVRFDRRRLPVHSSSIEKSMALHFQYFTIINKTCFVRSPAIDLVLVGK